MKKYLAILIMLILTFTLSACNTQIQTSYDIRIVVPAGTEDDFSFSHEEISSKTGSLIITPLEGFDNVEFALDVTEGDIAPMYPPTYLTTGTSIERGVEIGAWYRFGIKLANPTDKDIEFFIRVNADEIRLVESVTSEGFI